MIRQLRTIASDSKSTMSRSRAPFALAALAALLTMPLPIASPAIAAPAREARIRYPAGHYPVLALPGGQRQEIKSLLNVARPLWFGGYVWNDAGVPPGPAWIRIDLARQLLSVFRGGHEIGTAVILYGTDGKPTPSGLFAILERAKEHRSNLYDAEMPYMLRLTRDGVAIHASNVGAGSATHGCIGIPIAFARRLFDQMKVGDQVAIVRT